MNSIEAKGLVKKFGDLVAVDGISIEVMDGELFGFLGPNGAGKTTTIKMLTTLIKPTAGTAKVGGYDVIREPERVRRIVGVVPQELTVDDDLTGWENLMLQAGLYHIPRHEAKRRAEELLELVGLSEHAHRKVEQYSGGMRKRLELACGLIHDPEILFLDEPTLGLDAHTRSAIWDYIRRLRSEFGVTIFLTTHYLEEADALCDRVAIIDRGKLLVCGKPSELKEIIGGDVIELDVNYDSSILSTMFMDLSGIKSVDYHDGVLRMTVEKGEMLMPQIVERLLKNGAKVSRITMKRPSLEEVFLKLTGRSIRDELSSWEETFKQHVTLRRMRR